MTLFGHSVAVGVISYVEVRSHLVEHPGVTWDMTLCPYKKGGNLDMDTWGEGHVHMKAEVGPAEGSPGPLAAPGVWDTDKEQPVP